MGTKPYLTNRGHLWTLVVAMKTRTKADRADSKSVTMSLTPADHTRLQRHAPAHGVKNNKYCQMAIQFLMDCEDAFGGPMNLDLRKAATVRVKSMGEKYRRMLSTPEKEGA